MMFINNLSHRNHKQSAYNAKPKAQISAFAFAKFLNFQPLVICACTARFVLDVFGNHIVGFSYAVSHFLFQLQKTYNNRCREMVQHDNQLSVAMQTVTTSTKELEKVRTLICLSLKLMFYFE